MKILNVFGIVPITNDQHTLYRSVGRISQQVFLVMLVIPSVSAKSFGFRSLFEHLYFHVFPIDYSCLS